MSDDPLAPYIPRPDARERFSLVVRAPAHVVYGVATTFDMQSVPLVRGIIRVRERLLGGRARPRVSTAFLDELRSLGWACLLERPGQIVIGGASCQPWLADVVFVPVPGAFQAYAEPGRVKIAWTLETIADGPERTVLATETRVVATDPAARARFLRYWRWARFGIVPIRWLLLPAIRAAAERAWQTRSDSASGGASSAPG